MGVSPPSHFLTPVVCFTNVRTLFWSTKHFVKYFLFFFTSEFGHVLLPSLDMFSTRGGNRTRTPVGEQHFKCCVSTYSTIQAFVTTPWGVSSLFYVNGEASPTNITGVGCPTTISPKRQFLSPLNWLNDLTSCTPSFKCVIHLFSNWTLLRTLPVVPTGFEPVTSPWKGDGLNPLPKGPKMWLLRRDVSSL